MEPLRLHHLQPAMVRRLRILTPLLLILSFFYSQWNTLCSDVEIDDSRARKVLGYRNRFTNADTVSEALWQEEVLECSDGKE